uniref:Uncharacterized protein n=1 Tax=Ditylum brightwellii TaxID=49249 RepID=A0A7S4QXJ1_9STRA|mmetsp:Transcript_23297/g.30826  ORF Transcript_23297/g.30826 Transcript_23297/m.30826 type:complete len:111 (+) Transcript_23297:103-435(+)
MAIKKNTARKRAPSITSRIKDCPNSQVKYEACIVLRIYESYILSQRETRCREKEIMIAEGACEGVREGSCDVSKEGAKEGEFEGIREGEKEGIMKGIMEVFLLKDKRVHK